MRNQTLLRFPVIRAFSRRPASFVAALGAALALAGCVDGSPVDAGLSPTELPTLSSVLPANAAASVDPGAPIVLTFSNPMMAGMEALVVVHEGTLTGPVVVGTATWSATRTTLTFAPATPLKSQTTYLVHLSPGLLGANGRPINLGACLALDGRYATGEMMGSAGGMMNGSWGPGMMGDGWRASDGTFGMYFTFTTA